MNVFWLLVAAFIGLIYVAMRHFAKFEVRKKIVINQPVGKTFDVVMDLQTWPKWSPWLLAEPNAFYEVFGHGRQAKWSGKVVGKARMRFVKCITNSTISSHMYFLKPFRSFAKVSWFFREESPTSAEVTWVLRSRMPFALFWMAKKMRILCGKDFERGLKRLKQYVEHGKMDHHIEITGVVDFSGLCFLGKMCDSKHSTFQADVEKDFAWLNQHMNAPDFVKDCGAMIYEKFDYFSDDITYFCGYSGNFKPPQEQVGGLSFREIKPMKAFKVLYRGGYEGIESAWSALMANVQASKLKIPKGHFPFEVYKVGPLDTDDQEKWVTELYCPIFLK